MKKVTCVVRGMLYTKYVDTVPVTAVDVDFPLTGKIDTGFIRGTVYTKCAYTVPVFALDQYFPLLLKKVF